jgi:hypothetical protein
MSKKFASLFLALALVCLSTASLFGQVNALATLSGTVTDKSGAVAPGAEVKISNKQTGLQRTDTANSSGNYSFNLIPAGIYEVRVSLKGFSTGVYENVEVFVGRTTTIDAILSPSQVAESVTVESSGASLVDLQKTDVSVPITSAQVENMPLNGRDFVNLATLAPGARAVNSYDPTKQRIGVFATNGSSGRNVNVTVNGVDNKDNTVGGPVMQLPLEAVQEFNISTQRFSAANGRSEGAAVSVITKSGTNAFHGALYFFDREAAFQTLNYFEQTAHGGNGNKAPFSRQQFGGSVGGPVKKDKTFLFFALERSREDTSINANAAAFTNAQAFAGAGAAPYGITPIPTQTISTPYFDWRYNGRLDHRFNDKNNLSVSYSNQNNRGLNDQAGGSSDGSQTNFTTNQLIIANASLNSVLSPNIVNAFTAGYQYWNNLISADKFVANATFPSVSIGTNPNVPQESYQVKWQFKDDIAITKGKHSFKFGFDFLNEPKLGGFFVTDPTPVISFFDDPTKILANKTTYPNGFATPGAVSSITQATTGNPYFADPGAKMFGIYFQDDWKVSRRLSLNLGIRWDRDYALNGASSQLNNRPYLELKAIGSAYAGIPTDDTKDFSPRIGLAYSLSESGKHVLRFGYGLYFGQIFQNIPLFMEQQANPTIFSTVTATNNCTPGSTSTCTSDTLGNGIKLSAWRFGIDPLPPTPIGSTNMPAGSSGQLMNPDYRNPYSEQFNGGYSWQLTGDSVFEAEYVHTLGVHESKSIVINPKINGVRFTDGPFAALGLPVLGRITDLMSIGRSRYDGMNLSYRKRLSKHYSINASYVLSRALAYNGNAAAFGNAPTDLLNWFSPHDLGPTPADQKHTINISGIVKLKYGVTIAPIMNFGTGRPINILEGQNDTFGFGGGAGSTHTIVLNSDPTNFLGTATFSVAQLQACLAANTCHQLNYNPVRGENFFQLDMRVSKSIRFGEKAKLDLIFQAFDMTNRANFGGTYQTSIRSATFLQPTGFITPSGVVVPKTFAAEFGAHFSF